MDWNAVKDLLVLGFAAYMGAQFKQLVTGVNALNVKMAVVVTKVEHHEEEIHSLKRKQCRT